MKSLLNSAAFEAANEGRVGVVKRLNRLLTRGDWIYLASLLVPLFVYNLVLKVVRIVTRPDPPGFLGFLDQVRSDLLFNLGFAALWIGIFDHQNSTEVAYYRIDDTEFVIDRSGSEPRP